MITKVKGNQTSKIKFLYLHSSLHNDLSSRSIISIRHVALTEDIFDCIGPEKILIKPFKHTNKSNGIPERQGMLGCRGGTVIFTGCLSNFQIGEKKVDV